jgi:dihydroorotate dehydrogenase
LEAERENLSRLHGKRVPVAVKIAPDLEEAQIEALARVFNESGIDGVIATNTTIARDAVASHPLGGQTGGLSGAPLLAKSTEVLKAFRQRLRGDLPIIGVGGILCGADAETKMAAGAALVQVYSGLVYRGPALVYEVLATLARAKKS